MASWFAPVPTRRLVLVRSLTFLYAAGWLVVRGPYLADIARLPDRRFDPIGVLGALESPPAGATVVMVWAVTLVACALTAANRWVRPSAPVGAIGMLVIATYTSSFGQVFHTENLLVLHTAVLAFAALVEPVDGAAPDAGHPNAGHPVVNPTFERQTSGWPLHLMMGVVVAAYVVAGVAKLRYGGGEWVTGDVLRNAVAMDNLRKLLFDDWYSPLGGWLASVAWIWGPIAAITLVVKLAAPLALVPGRVRYAWVALAWGFHAGILILMAISFPYQLLGVAYAAFLPVERIADAARSRLPRWLSGRWPGRAVAERRNSVTALRDDVTA